MKTLAIPLMMLFLATPGFAGDKKHKQCTEENCKRKEKCTKEGCEGKKGKCEGDCHGHGWGHYSKKGFLILSPRYFSNSNDNRNAAYLNNGFAAPSSGMFAFHSIFGKRYDSGIQMGLSFMQARQSRESGVNVARYNYMYAGVFTGYDFLKHNPHLDLVLGSTLGYGSSRLQVFSGVSDGELTEHSFMFEPSLSIAKKVGKRIKLGIVTSYYVPFAANSSIVGQDLGVSKIYPQGFNVGLQVIFGKFGHEHK